MKNSQICVILIIVIPQIYAAPRRYCGSSLRGMLSSICITYYTPEEHRERRQIVSECCHKPCTLEYMLEYCQSYNSKELSKRLKEESKTEKENTAVNFQSDSVQEPVSSKSNSQLQISERDYIEKTVWYKNAVPEPRLGQIEESQPPFYISEALQKLTK